jgi:TP901-1 family phage major tail protein
MAERKLAGKDMLFFIDPAGGTSYSTVVCLTSQTYDRTKNTIDATTKCGPDTLNGTATRTISLEGVVLYGPDAGKVSEYALDNYWEDDTLVGWKLAEVSPEAGSIIYQGTGRLSDLSTTYGQDGAATFSATLQVSGTPDKILTPDLDGVAPSLGTIAATSVVVQGLTGVPSDFEDDNLTGVVTVATAAAPTVVVGTPSSAKDFSGADDGLFDTPHTYTGLTTATDYIAKVTLNYGGTVTIPFTTA